MKSLLLKRCSVFFAFLFFLVCSATCSSIADNSNSTLPSISFAYEYQTPEEYQQNIKNDGWFGLFRDLEVAGFTALFYKRLYHTWYVPVTTLESQKLPAGALLPKGNKIPFTQVAVAYHSDPDNAFNPFFWNYYWDITGLFYCIKNFQDKSLILGPVSRGKEYIALLMNGTMSLADFLDRWDKDVHRSIRDPLYGEMSKFIWLEFLLFSVLLRRKFRGPFTYVWQDYYFFTFHMASFFMQATSLALRAAQCFSQGALPSILVQYDWKLNPRSVEPQLDYALYLFFAPLLGFFYFTSFFNKRSMNIAGNILLIGFTLIVLNSLPSIMDKTKVVAGTFSETIATSVIPSLLPTNGQGYVEHLVQLAKSVITQAQQVVLNKQFVQELFYFPVLAVKSITQLAQKGTL